MTPPPIPLFDRYTTRELNEFVLESMGLKEKRYRFRNGHYLTVFPSLRKDPIDAILFCSSLH